MLSPEVAASFLLVALLLALTPGPDNLFVMAQSARHGPRAGLLVTLGLCTGLIGHTLAVTLGVASLIAASATAFTLLKLAGAAYLLWLAWQALREGSSTGQTAPALSAAQLYRRGILMNLTNPKVSVFFLAFLPQFVTPEGPAVAVQLVQLGLLFVLATLLVFGTLALMTGQAGRVLLGSPRAGRAMSRISALIFAALALRLLHEPTSA